MAWLISPSLAAISQTPSLPSFSFLQALHFMRNTQTRTYPRKFTGKQSVDRSPLVITSRFRICNLIHSPDSIQFKHSDTSDLCKMNAPDRYERFVVPEGDKKVGYERDMKVMNAATFTVQREDHTVGNVLRMQLHRDPSVLFAGYKLPHPLEYKIVVKIQTTSQSSPMQAYNMAITDLTKELDHLKTVFEQESSQKQAEYY